MFRVDLLQVKLTNITDDDRLTIFRKIMLGECEMVHRNSNAYAWFTDVTPGLELVSKGRAEIVDNFPVVFKPDGELLLESELPGFDVSTLIDGQSAFYARLNTMLTGMTKDEIEQYALNELSVVVSQSLTKVKMIEFVINKLKEGDVL